MAIRLPLAPALAATLTASGCIGNIGDGPSGRAGDADGDPTATAAVHGGEQLLRLTRVEYLRTVRDLTGVDVGVDLPTFDVNTIIEGKPDKRYYFDNHAASQKDSALYVETLYELASDVAELVAHDDARLTALLPCAPAGSDDAACMDQFVRAFGRRALRRPLDDAEVDALVPAALEYAAGGPLATTDYVPAFGEGVAFVVRALLQHPELVYRVEVGAGDADDGVMQLGPFELATRMSYLLWRSCPDDALLDAAAGGVLDSSEGVESEVSRMLADDRARDAVDSFFGMWMGYADAATFVGPEMADKLATETRAAVERVVFDDDAAWTDLFTLDETYIDAELAGFYDMNGAPEEGFGWVAYGDDSARGGVLSHGSILSTSTPGSLTLRGLFVRERMLCQPINLPVAKPGEPAVNVDAIDDPSLGECKMDRYAAHEENPGCAGCHTMLDPIGKGLARYGTLGTYQETEPGLPDCPLPVEGYLTFAGEQLTFEGPAELGALLAGPGVADTCFPEQLFRYLTGRIPLEDEAALEALVEAQAASGGRLTSMLAQWVTRPAFRVRHLPEE